MRFAKWWAVIVLVVLAGIAVGIRDSEKNSEIDALTAERARYLADSTLHERTVDSLVSERRRGDSLARVLRRATRPIRALADSARVTSEAAVAAALFAPTAADSALHYRDAYIASRAEAEHLRKVVADMDSAATLDSIGNARVAEALSLTRARLDTANGLVVTLGDAVGQLRPSWTDRVVLAAGVEPWSGRPTLVLAYSVVSLRDVGRAAAKIIPGWMR